KKINWTVPLLNNGDSVSPDGRLYVYLDRLSQSLYSLDLSSGKVINLTEKLFIPKIDTSFDGSKAERGELNGGITWLSDRDVLVNDKYDIWLIEASGKVPPVNLTNGFGRKHNITFEKADYNQFIPKSKLLLLKGIDNKTKDQYFFKINLSNRIDPELLSKGGYAYDLKLEPGEHPLISHRTKEYIVQIQNGVISPNYYMTNDFRIFKRLTDVQSEQAYNWLTNDLVDYRLPTGYPLQAIIYKPENFDPAKKYPVIITYYEKLTQHKNEYQLPGLMFGEINIPWMVSRGYVVVTPDIHYQIGFPLKSAFNCVMAAANYIKKLSFVDSNKIGIMGHSWGGFETNYIVTHTNMFAAAFSSCGSADMIANYGSLTKSGSSLQYMSEVFQTRIGATLWNRPDLYIENSSIFQADKVTAPVLLMNNKIDGIVPFSQGVEFFTALRRLGKKVWMLQYDGQDHNLLDKQAQYDYTIRTQQFFDHYLKGLPAPVWMTRGIPASLKGTTDGFEYDKEIKTPPPSPLIDPNKDPKIIYDYNN
ncbi:MAG TPA: prolyl oligopeptidase family serine peptidase, partial [Mucilaginibacter sp.]